MKHPAYSLTLDRANIVLQTMREVCEFRDWILLAAHVRTSHVHAVVDRVDAPNKTMADFKAYASRALNQIEGNQTRWAREGSTRPLRTDRVIEAAIRYVIDSQGEPMAVYMARQRSPD